MADDSQRILGNDGRAVVDAITARLVPTDEIGPGAREAQVVRYIELALASDYREHMPKYVEGLAAIEAYTKAKHGSGFVSLSEEQQDTVLREVETGKASPSLAGFFELVLAHTLEGMFGDPYWGGNYGYVGWNLIQYPGPRFVWSEVDQQLDVVIEPVFRSAVELREQEVR